MNSFRLPLFSELRSATNVLIAGAGGGFDVFTGLPLYFKLVAADKNVIFANLTFSTLPPGSAGREITPVLTSENRGQSKNRGQARLFHFMSTRIWHEKKRQ